MKAGYNANPNVQCLVLSITITCPLLKADENKSQRSRQQIGKLSRPTEETSWVSVIIVKY